MFAYLALAGDLGCSLGPSLVGLLAEGSDKGLQQRNFGSGDLSFDLVACSFLSETNAPKGVHKFWFQQ